MSEALNTNRMYLLRGLPIIANSEILIPTTSPAHMLFLGRKVAAAKFLRERLSEVAQEELLHYIEHCNEQIKKFLAL